MMSKKKETPEELLKYAVKQEEIANSCTVDDPARHQAMKEMEKALDEAVMLEAKGA